MKTVSIDAPGARISTLRDDTIKAFTAFSNRKFFFLPENMAEKFPKLEIYVGSSCSLTVIIRENFLNLKYLKRLTLNDNKIEVISDDVFDDLFALEILKLSRTCL